MPELQSFARTSNRKWLIETEEWGVTTAYSGPIGIKLIHKILKLEATVLTKLN